MTDGPAGPDAPDRELTPEETALGVVAASSDISAATAHDATEYFLGTKPAPGHGAQFPLEVDFGTLDAHDYRTVTFRTLRVEELDEADKRSEMKDGAGEVIGQNTFIASSWIFAMACEQPQLGPILNQRNSSGGHFPDAAALVADLFKEAPGTLIQAATAVRRRARLGVDDKAVREVEAGKTSS